LWCCYRNIVFGIPSFPISMHEWVNTIFIITVAYCQIYVRLVTSDDNCSSGVAHSCTSFLGSFLLHADLGTRLERNAAILNISTNKMLSDAQWCTVMHSDARTVLHCDSLCTVSLCDTVRFSSTLQKEYDSCKENRPNRPRASTNDVHTVWQQLYYRKNWNRTPAPICWAECCVVSSLVASTYSTWPHSR
jgi:hypothetical protein